VLPGTLQLIAAAGVLVAIVVFVAAYRFALRECADVRDQLGQADLPRAAIHDGGRRWTAGARRQRALRSMSVVQAGFVAVAITSIFVMAVCMAGIIGVMLLG
jgi:hypothetical protein